MNNFTFDAKEHLYKLNGKPLTGVTTALKAIAKPALIQWAANEAVKYVTINTLMKPLYPEEADKTSWIIDFNQWTKTLEEARTAHRKKKEEAGSKGTDVHGEIEGLIKIQMEVNDGHFDGLEVPGRTEQIKKFVDWAIQNKVKFLASEKQVYSEKYFIAGTLDFLCEINGKKFVGDIKTSNAIYGREFFAQCAAYRLMLEEQGETGFEGSVIIRLGKNGDFEDKYSYAYDDDRELFLACLTVYRKMETF